MHLHNRTIDEIKSLEFQLKHFDKSMVKIDLFFVNKIYKGNV